MCEYIGKCDTIDWNALLETLKDQEPAYVGPRHRAGDPAPGIDDVAKMWDNAGYKMVVDGGSAGWDMLLPGINFPVEIALDFAKWVGLDNYTNCWISRIHPGNVAPWHWDVTDDEATLNKTVKHRYHCLINKPEPGHVLLVEDKAFYMGDQGSVWKWPDRKSWHGAANCGFTPWYSFHFWH